MAGKKISELDEALALEVGALLEVVQSGQNFRIDANLIANIVAGIGNPAAVVTPPALDYDLLVNFGTITVTDATNAEHIAASGADAGVSGATNVTWAVFILGNLDDLVQLALSPSAEQVQIRYRKGGTWSGWQTVGGGGGVPSTDDSEIRPNFNGNHEELFSDVGLFFAHIIANCAVDVNGDFAIFTEAAGLPNTYFMTVSNYVLDTGGSTPQAIDVGGVNPESFSACYLEPTRFAAFTGSVGLRCYEFDSLLPTPIFQVGNIYGGFTVANTDFTALCHLDDQLIAFFDTASNNLQSLTFDGTDFAPSGNALNIPAATGRIEISPLSSTEIAFYSAAENKLYYITYSGSDWTIQSELSVSTTLDFSLTSINSFDVFMAFLDDKKIKQYRLNSSTNAFEYIKDVKDLDATATEIVINSLGDSTVNIDNFSGYVVGESWVNPTSAYVNAVRYSWGIGEDPYIVENSIIFDDIPSIFIRGDGGAYGNSYTLVVPEKSVHQTETFIDAPRGNNMIVMDQDNRATSKSIRAFWGRVSYCGTWDQSGFSGLALFDAALYKNGALFGQWLPAASYQPSGGGVGEFKFTRIVKFELDDYVEIWHRGSTAIYSTSYYELDVQFLGWAE